MVPVKQYSTIRDTALCSRRSTYGTQDWKRKETTNGGERWGSLVQNSTEPLSPSDFHLRLVRSNEKSLFLKMEIIPNIQQALSKFQALV